MGGWCARLCASSAPRGRIHRKPTKPGREPIQGWADGVGS